MTTEPDAAQELVELARSDPTVALARAEELLRGDLDDAARSVTARAAGLAARAAATIDASVDHLEVAVASAVAADRPMLVAEAKLSLAGSLAIGGDLDGALRSLDDRPPRLPANLERRYEFQRATILARTGAGPAALDIFDRVLPGFRADDDVYFVALTLMNRGRISIELADVEPASADLTEAHALYTSAGSLAAAAYVLHNLGELAIVTGDLCEALELLEVSRDELERLTTTSWEPEVTRGEALLDAGLFGEAERLAERLVGLMGESGFGLERAEALLLLSRARLGLDRRDAAHAAAISAAQEFAAQGRPGWTARAQLAALRSEPPDAPPDAIEHRVGALVERFRSGGLLAHAAEALAEGVVRVSASAPARGASMLARLEELPHPKRIEQRMLFAYAQAFHRAASGNRAGALRAIGSVIRLAQRHRLSLGATELRVTASHHTARLAQLGLRLALDGGDPRLVFRYSELDRAASLRARPVRPPREPADRSAIAEIRSLARAAERASAVDAVHIERDLRRATRRFQELERFRPTSSVSADVSVPTLAELRARLSDRVFVSMLQVDGRLLAQVIRRTVTRTVDLGPSAEWSDAFERMRALAGLAAQGIESAASGQYAEADVVGARLAACLPDDAELIIAPPPGLLDAPWSLLPPCRSVPTTLVPSAHVVTRADRALGARPAVVAVAGPHLEHADAEVAAVARVWSAASALTAGEATASQVLDGLAQADIVHVACHGRYRRGNPLMSQLSLADGPLLIADIEELGTVAPIVVLSACHGSAGDAHNAETMGVVTTLLGAGAACVVAGVDLVQDDDSTVALMQSLHQRIRAGDPVSHALHEARVGVGAVDGAHYQCFGSTASVTRA